jgi:lipoyl(octanoyl) transferase
MEWKTSPKPVDYQKAVAFMETRARQIREGAADELVWLLEHPALYTAGTSAASSDLIDTLGLPVYKTGRGGQYTYHGPGQRIAYVMLDLRKRAPDVRLYVQRLERWIIAALAALGVTGFTREGRVGVWVETGVMHGGVLHGDLAGERARSESRGSVRPPTEAKIAALGVRIRQWVTYHGISLNVNPDLTLYRGIVPCGIRDFGVTSLEALGVHATLPDVDHALIQSFGSAMNEEAPS